MKTKSIYNKPEVDSLLNFMDKVEDNSNTPKNQITSYTNRDIRKTIQRAINSHAPIATNLKIDDKDFKQADNFYNFTTMKKYALTDPPFAMQMHMVIQALGEWNPLKSDTKWLNTKLQADTPLDEYRDHICLLKQGICPKTKVTKSELIKQKILNPYSQLIACWGQRSGKSLTIAQILAYMAHGHLKLQNPSEVFGVATHASLLSYSLVSLTFKQALENLYHPFYQIVGASDWFQNYFQMLDEYSRKQSVELYKFNDTFLSFRSHNMIVAVSGPDKRILRGRARPFFAIDEADWLFSSNKSASVKYNVEEIYAALRNSMMDIVRGWKNLLNDGYNSIVPPMACNISSPSSKFAFMIPMIEKSKHSRNIFTSHLSTPEVNPKFTYEDLYEEIVPLQGEEAFLRDFMAVPPLSSSPFISDIQNFKLVVNPNRVNGVTINQKQTIGKSDKLFSVGGFQIVAVDNKVPKLMSIDGGEGDNSFAFTISHKEKVDGKFKPIFDVMGEIIPSKEAPINFTLVTEHILMPLIKKFNVKFCVCDRWNSIKLLSDLAQDCDIDTEVYSVKYRDFVSFREGIYNGKLELPRPELKPKKILTSGDEGYPYGFKQYPISHFIFQCLTVQDQAGKAVTKGKNVTDDLFRAAVLAHSFLVDVEYQELFEGTSANKGSPGLAIMGSLSGFGSYNPGQSSNMGVVGTLSGTGQSMGTSSRVFARK